MTSGAHRVLVVSRSLAPDVGGYQRQMQLVLPALGAGFESVWVGAQRDRNIDRVSSDTGADRTVRVRADLLPRRVRGVADLLTVSISIVILLSLGRSQRRTLLVLSPAMHGAPTLVQVARRLRWGVVARYPTSGDLSRPKGRRVAGTPGVRCVAPSHSQTIERDDVAVRQIVNAVELSPEQRAPREAGRRIMFTGRLVARKHPEVVVDAWRTIADRNPSWELVLVGGGGEEADSVEASVRAAAATCARCTLLGNRPDARELLRQSDIFVFPSEREGLPNVVLEAMAAGVPVIADPDHALEWFGVAAPLLPWDGAASSMADALQGAIDAEDLRSEVADRARRFVAERHSPADVAHQYRELFLEAAS